MLHLFGSVLLNGFSPIPGPMGHDNLKFSRINLRQCEWVLPIVLEMILRERDQASPFTSKIYTNPVRCSGLFPRKWVYTDVWSTFIYSVLP
jgi:hypothetical protein